MWMLKLSLLLLLSLTFECTFGDQELGCPLAPSLSLANAPEDQEGLLDNLRHHHLYGQKFTCEGPTHKFTYTFVICGDATKDKKNATIIQTDKSQGISLSLGSRYFTRISGNKEVWTMMSFTKGDNGSAGCQAKNLESEVMLLCDRTQPVGKLSLLYEDTSYCQFVFELRTSALCGKGPGMSGFTILFIIMIVAFLLYWIVGFLYLRFVIKAQGIQQIPHRLFWFGFGNKIADVCSVVCRCDRYCGEDEPTDSGPPYTSGYSPIGEPNRQSQPFGSQNFQSDSPLLNP